MGYKMLIKEQVGWTVEIKMPKDEVACLSKGMLKSKCFVEIGPAMAQYIYKYNYFIYCARAFSFYSSVLLLLCTCPVQGPIS